MNQVLHLLERLAAIPPVLIVFGAVLVYGLALLVRYHSARIVMTAWALVCLSLLLSSGGRATLLQVEQLPTLAERVDCIYSVAKSGKLWDGKQVARVSVCRFHGTGAGAQPVSKEGRGLLSQAARELRSAYGRP